VFAVAAVALLAVPAAGAKRTDVPGVTDTQIPIGGTGPLTGDESAYEPVLSRAQAYFSYVNDHGGVLGRKVVYKVEDDQYKQLVEQDNVFAIFNAVGTEQSLAIRSYLHAQKLRARRPS
jgi:branched-chain amino acid transport system substrate-binding protein